MPLDAFFSFLFAHYSSVLLSCNENSLVTRNISHESKIIVIIDVFKFNDLIFCVWPDDEKCVRRGSAGHPPKLMGKEVETGYSHFLCFFTHSKADLTGHVVGSYGGRALSTGLWSLSCGSCVVCDAQGHDMKMSYCVFGSTIQ